MGRKLDWKRNTEASVARKRSQLTTEGDFTCEDRHARPAPSSLRASLAILSSGFVPDSGDAPSCSSPPCSKPSDTIARSGLAVPRQLAPPADPASPPVPAQIRRWTNFFLFHPFGERVGCALEAQASAVQIEDCKDLTAHFETQIVAHCSFSVTRGYDRHCLRMESTCMNG